MLGTDAGLIFSMAARFISSLALELVADNRVNCNFEAIDKSDLSSSMA